MGGRGFGQPHRLGRALATSSASARSHLESFAVSADVARHASTARHGTDGVSVRDGSLAHRLTDALARSDHKNMDHWMSSLLLFNRQRPGTRSRRAWVVKRPATPCSIASSLIEPPCHPATIKISRSVAASSISMPGANGCRYGNSCEKTPCLAARPADRRAYSPAVAGLSTDAGIRRLLEQTLGKSGHWPTFSAHVASTTLLPLSACA